MAHGIAAVYGGHVQLSRLLHRYLEYCDLKGVSAGSRRIYEQNIGDWIAWRAEQSYPDDIHQVNEDELRAHFRYLKHDHIPHNRNRYRPTLTTQRGLAPASQNLRWRMLAAFWSFLGEERKLLKRQRDYFSARRVPCPKIPKRKRKGVEQSSVEQLLEVIDGPDEVRWRDRAIVLLLAQSGMRVGELVALREEAIDFEARAALITGKGDKQRMVYWGPLAAQALAQYRRCRRPSTGGYVFLGVGSRSKSDGHLGVSAVRDMLHKRAGQAGVTLPERQPAHGFRRGFARRSLRKGMPAPHLQQLLGHENAKTTQIYVEEELDTELQQIHHQVWDSDSYGVDWSDEI